MSRSRLSYEKTLYFYPEGDKNKDKYDEEFYSSITLRFFDEIKKIVKSFGRPYILQCDYMHNDYNPEYHMLEYTLSYIFYEEDNVLNPDRYTNIKLDFIAIETILVEIATEYNLVLE